MRRSLVIGAACGAAWGLVAMTVFLAMFTERIPSPGEASPLLAVAIVVSYVPFLAAAGVETALGRRSPQLAEVAVVTVLCGMVLGLALAAAASLAGSRLGGRRGRRELPT